MSQSEAHKRLVIGVTKALKIRHSEIAVIADIQDAPGDAVPHKIGGFRPDVYARMSTNGDSILLAEAKTRNDIGTKHTHAQISAFLEYFERRKAAGAFVLAVSGESADFAKTVLRYAYQARPSQQTKIYVFDELDFWQLDQVTGRIWRLD